MNAGTVRTTHLIHFPSLGFLTNPQVRHLLLAGSGALFQEGVARFLGAQPGVRLTQMRFVNVDGLMAEIRMQRPDLVLVLGHSADLTPILVLSKSPDWLRSHPRLFFMETNTNTLHMLNAAGGRTRHLPLNTPGDLLHALFPWMVASHPNSEAAAY